MTVITASDFQRFWSKVGVAEEDDCWPWLGATKKATGYGSFRIGRIVYTASRIAYISTRGSIADLLDVCHRCDNPVCCNPSHLFTGTRSENMLDCLYKHRNSILSMTDALYIYNYDDRAASVVAAEYGVTIGCIYHLRDGRSWSHVTGHLRGKAA